MSQISKCPRVTVILSYWEASGEVSKLRYKSLLYCVSVGSYCRIGLSGKDQEFDFFDWTAGQLSSWSGDAWDAGILFSIQHKTVKPPHTTSHWIGKPALHCMSLFLPLSTKLQDLMHCGKSDCTKEQNWNWLHCCAKKVPWSAQTIRT